jgi:5-methylcytosine-specific restriction endonuclease McrA
MAAPDDLIEAEPADVPLPLDFGPDGLQNRICWYCGGGEGPFETEHQVPVSRGGNWRGNLVWSCADCNHLKESLTAEEFHKALKARLGTAVVLPSCSCDW